MTAAELNAALATLGWSQRELARRLDADAMTVNRWAHGRQHIPEAVAAWLTAMRTALAKVPAVAEEWWDA